MMNNLNFFEKNITTVCWTVNPLNGLHYISFAAANHWENVDVSLLRGGV